jgi:molybdenum cofactor cytidylyltransferase
MKMGVEGIILAAGLSSRAASYKMTLAFNGKTVIENTIDNMLGFCKRIIVVGGYQIEKLQPIVEKYSKVELVLNEDYIQGMYSSVKKGMSSIREERFFFTPGDYPLIEAEVYRQLLLHHASVVIPTFEGRKGHPILFHNNIIEVVLKGIEYKTLREVISNQDVVLAAVNCRGIIMDLDTWSDYEVMLSSLYKGVPV